MAGLGEIEIIAIQLWEETSPIARTWALITADAREFWRAQARKLIDAAGEYMVKREHDVEMVRPGGINLAPDLTSRGG